MTPKQPSHAGQGTGDSLSSKPPLGNSGPHSLYCGCSRMSLLVIRALYQVMFIHSVSQQIPISILYVPRSILGIVIDG